MCMRAVLPPVVWEDCSSLLHFQEPDGDGQGQGFSVDALAPLSHPCARSGEPSLCGLAMHALSGAVIHFRRACKKTAYSFVMVLGGAS